MFDKKPSILEDTKVGRAARLRKLKRDLIKVIHDNEMDMLTGLHDTVLAEYLVMSLMNITKVIDQTQEIESL